MGKQFEFYSYKNDDEMIANTLRSVFGELLCVPRYKGDLSPFDICANDRLMYLTGKSFQQYISYYTHEYYDGTTAEVLDYVKRWHTLLDVFIAVLIIMIFLKWFPNFIVKSKRIFDT